MSSVLSLRDGIVKAHRQFSHADLVYYNRRLVEFGGRACDSILCGRPPACLPPPPLILRAFLLHAGRSIFRHGAIPNATNVHSIVETCKEPRDRTMVGACPAKETSCTYAPGKTECCSPGEMCIQGVGCRC